MKRDLNLLAQALLPQSPLQPRKLAALGAVLLVPALFPLAAQPLTGGPFVLVGAPATGGTSSGGTYRLSGYVAAAGAETSSGESFDLTCGLVGVYVATGGDVELRVTLTPDGNARIWWAPEVTGYLLESAGAPGPGAVWEPVDPQPATNEYVTPPLESPRFFRLRKP